MRKLRAIQRHFCGRLLAGDQTAPAAGRLRGLPALAHAAFRAQSFNMLGSKLPTHHPGSDFSPLSGAFLFPGNNTQGTELCEWPAEAPLVLSTAGYRAPVLDAGAFLLVSSNRHVMGAH
jgi:hypothetical protein